VHKRPCYEFLQVRAKRIALLHRGQPLFLENEQACGSNSARTRNAIKKLQRDFQVDFSRSLNVNNVLILPVEIKLF